MTAAERAREVPATDEVLRLFRDYRAAKAIQDQAADWVAVLRDALISALPDESVKVMFEGRPVGAKTVTLSWRVNTTKLRAEYPEVADDCMKATTAVRLTLPSIEERRRMKSHEVARRVVDYCADGGCSSYSRGAIWPWKQVGMPLGEPYDGLVSTT